MRILRFEALVIVNRVLLRKHIISGANSGEAASFGITTFWLRKLVFRLISFLGINNPRYLQSEILKRGTSGFTVLRYRVSILCCIAVLRGKTNCTAVLSFYDAVCGIRLKLISKFHLMRFSRRRTEHL